MYIDSQLLKDEIILFKQTNVISNTLGKMIMLMVTRVGIKYRADDDSKSGAILHCIQGLKYVRTDNTPLYVFNYFSTILLNYFRHRYTITCKKNREWDEYVSFILDSQQSHCRRGRDV